MWTVIACYKWPWSVWLGVKAEAQMWENQLHWPKEVEGYRSAAMLWPVFTQRSQSNFGIQPRWVWFLKAIAALNIACSVIFHVMSGRTELTQVLAVLLYIDTRLRLKTIDAIWGPLPKTTFENSGGQNKIRTKPKRAEPWPGEPRSSSKRPVCNLIIYLIKFLGDFCFYLASIVCS